MSLINRHKKMQHFEKDASGKYKYIGNWQFFRGNAAGETKTVIILLVMMVLGIVGIGCIPGASIGKWYVSGPYAFSFLFAGITVFYCISVMISHWIMMEHEYKSAMFGIKLCSAVTTFLMAFTFIGQLVNVISNSIQVGGVIVALLAFIAFVGAAILCSRSRKSWHWELISEKERQSIYDHT